MSRTPRDVGDYADGSADQPMFDLPAAPAGRRAEQGRKAPTVAWGLCPGHTPEPGSRRERTGLIAAGNHLHWTNHTYQNVFGCTMPCSASGQRLCERPTRDGKMRRKLTKRQHDAGEPEIVTMKCRCTR